MAQPSVAREPSMEEILASIRRIIESNEPAAEGSARDFADYNEEPRVSDDAGDIAFVPEMAANDPGMPAREAAAAKPALQNHDFSAQSAAPAATVPERSLSLADVAARVRAASSRAPELPSEAPKSETKAGVPKFEATEAAEEPVNVSALNVVSSAPRPLPRPILPPIPELGVAGFNPDDVPAEPERMPRIVESAIEPTMPETPAAEPVCFADEPQAKADLHFSEPKAESLPAKIEAAANLMSAEAGAQVARSFGELADMLDGFNQQSVEEIAQDMLRPMLQEWLDDNLPTLVERLVREEIERVARGPRR
ncbi:PopZ family protein [Rhizobium panacihumi]|uniref:PopZ family protein n=1 Tax=Rhizobium panacihumi TaxID=2008450 RepID=UPI003D799B06